jgi:hypothetical protein
MTAPRLPYLILLPALLAGCVNMPTNPKDIKPTYTPSVTHGG